MGAVKEVWTGITSAMYTVGNQLLEAEERQEPDEIRDVLIDSIRQLSQALSEYNEVAN
jgi:hypothetical protein